MQIPGPNSYQLKVADFVIPLYGPVRYNKGMSATEDWGTLQKVGDRFVLLTVYHGAIAWGIAAAIHYRDGIEKIVRQMI